MKKCKVYCSRQRSRQWKLVRSMNAPRVAASFNRAEGSFCHRRNQLKQFFSYRLRSRCCMAGMAEIPDSEVDRQHLNEAFDFECRREVENCTTAPNIGSMLAETVSPG